MRRFTAPAIALAALIVLLTCADNPSVEANGFKWETNLKACLAKAKEARAEEEGREGPAIGVF